MFKEHIFWKYFFVCSTLSPSECSNLPFIFISFLYKDINFVGQISCIFSPMCNFSFYFAYVIFCHAIFNGIECYHGFPFLFLDLKSSLENFSRVLAYRGIYCGCTFVARRESERDHIRVSGVRGTQKTSDHRVRNLGKPFH